jgi:predicted 3-demethylubiquinone-9 3-methyltransferase (glyoxalase superfamily)
MATTATKPTGWRDGPSGSLKVAIRDITFASNYQDDGSETTVTAAQFGMKRIWMITAQGGMAAASALTTANEFAITLNSTGTSAEITLYENAAAGSPSAEKTDNEAHITGQTIRLNAEGW